jgi:hypothetical protein
MFQALVEDCRIYLGCLEVVKREIAAGSAQVNELLPVEAEEIERTINRFLHSLGENQTGTVVQNILVSRVIAGYVGNASRQGNRKAGRKIVSMAGKVVPSHRNPGLTDRLVLLLVR